jgi:hypothetical protein
VNRRGENRREHWANGGFLTITGDIGTYHGLESMGIDWMSGAEMSEAIPPAFSEYIGRAALAYAKGDPGATEVSPSASLNQYSDWIHGGDSLRGPKTSTFTATEGRSDG